MKKNYSIIIVLGFIVLVLIQLTGCASTNKILSGADQDAVLAYSEAKTDTLLAGMNANDYAMFSKDFDKEMLAAMSQSQFDSMKKDRDAKLGAYISRKVNNVAQQGGFYTVTYDTKFEKDNAVTVRVVFRAAEPHQISGLWFNK